MDNMSFNCEILADSINESGNRLTTMKLTYPRIVHAEFMTHRMFSRNAASSRAVPFKKMVKSIQENPFIPIAFQKNHKGMQGTEYLTEVDEQAARVNWLEARDKAIEYATYLNEDENVTKQLCNRLLEPYQWYEVIVTATEWENFFKLRCPQYKLFSEQAPMQFNSKKDFLSYVKQVEADEFKNQFDHLRQLDWLKINTSQADIHIQAIAELMWNAMNKSTPKKLKAGEWHIPYGDRLDPDMLMEVIDTDIPVTNGFDSRMDEAAVKIATARCARISYETLGDNPKIDYEADIKLHDILVQNGHASPLEHVAQAQTKKENKWSRNFNGFNQYREIVEKGLK